jgi:hypothetical protein
VVVELNGEWYVCIDQLSRIGQDEIKELGTVNRINKCTKDIYQKSVWSNLQIFRKCK